MLNDESELELFEVIQLHSAISLPPEKYNRIFRPPPAGKRKVILSTNIAESSITVPDVRYVIDFCLTKNLFCDPETSYPSLRLEWASKSSSDQRKGQSKGCQGLLLVSHFITVEGRFYTISHHDVILPTPV